MEEGLSGQNIVYHCWIDDYVTIRMALLETVNENKLTRGDYN